MLQPDGRLPNGYVSSGTLRCASRGPVDLEGSLLAPDEPESEILLQNAAPFRPMRGSCVHLDGWALTSAAVDGCSLRTFHAGCS